MIDERVLLKELDREVEFYDKDGNVVDPDYFMMKVEDIRNLINRQNRLPAEPSPMVVRTTIEKEITWQEIKQAANAGKLKDIIKSGDVLPLTLSNGDNVDLEVGYDEKGKAYFIFNRAMSEDHVMNSEWTNVGGYAASEMAEYANTEVFDMLPEYLKEMIEETTIVEYLKGERIESKHKLFCLSYTQVFGEKEYMKDQEPEDTLIDIFKDVHARSKVRCGAESASWWWLRSASSTDGFYYVDSSGGYDYDGASYSGAVALGFCIEPNQ